VEQDLATPLIVEQSVEQVLDGHIGVSPGHGFAYGGLQREMQLATDLAHSFSSPERSG
jgi:hypothetical protein